MQQGIVEVLRASKRIALDDSDPEAADRAAADYYRLRGEHINSNAGIPLHFSREQREDARKKRHDALCGVGLGTYPGS